jgi:hypothetical protein
MVVAVGSDFAPLNSAPNEPSSCALNAAPSGPSGPDFTAAAPESFAPAVAGREIEIERGFRMSPPFSTVYRPAPGGT